MPRLKSRSTKQRGKLIAALMKKQRVQQTHEAAERRRQCDRTGKKRKRAQETHEAAERRRRFDRTGKKRKRAQETHEAAERRRRCDRTGKKRKRAQEIHEVTERRRQLNRTSMKIRRAEETHEVTERRRQFNRTSMKVRRAEETHEAAERRRQCDRTGKKRKRAQETHEAAERRRATTRNQMNEVRKRRQEDCFACFRLKIAEGPIYSCISCYRLLYRETVMEMKAGNYSANKTTKKILKNASVCKLQTNGKSWICQTCHKSLKKGELPVQSWDNGLDLDPVPPELEDLRSLELRLISQRIPFMKLVGLPKGGQKSIHGSAVNVPSKLQSVMSLLPRLPATAEVVPLKLKRKLIYKGHHMYEFIRPSRVTEAIKWLKQNNPLYKDVDICPDWQTQWANDDPELWEALVNPSQSHEETANFDREGGQDDEMGVNEDSQAESTTTPMEDEEDRIAFEQTSKLRGIPYDTLLQEEEVTDGDNIYSLAPGENQTPCAFLTDDKFEELANPSKYPFGHGGLGDDKRPRKITAKRYFNQRLLHKDGRFAKDIEYLLTAQYMTEAKQVADSIQINLRQTRGQTFQNKRINAGLMKNVVNVQAMLRTDHAYKFMKNIRGSPAFWNSVLLDLLAMVRQLGIPTWFLTLSAADMQWPEVIRSIAHQYGTYLTDDDVKNMSWEQKCKWLRSNPVTAARQFNHRLNLFFKEVIGGQCHPIGELQDYMIRIEFQARGSPHAHTILWMKNAPKVGVDSDEDVINFINQHQTCTIPDEKEDDLRQLVLSLQKHVHSKTCRRNGLCRFRFPHPPSKHTIIGRPSTETDATMVTKELQAKEDVLRKVRTIMEDKNTSPDISLENLLQKAKVNQHEYQQALKLTRSGEQIILKRQPSEIYINHFNPTILKLWRANMDIQYILDAYSCIMYITSYMVKAERAMSELLQKVLEESKAEDLKSKLRKVGSAFLNNREVSAQEAVYRLLSLPLQRKSRQVVYINTATRDKRVSMLKPRHVLESMDDNDDNIFCTSALDRYASRPSELEEMSYAEFRATYNTSVGDPPDGETDHIPDVLDGPDDNERDDQDGIQRHPLVIKLRNNLGNMKRRRQYCIIRFHKEKKDAEERYRNLLMLYYPWRDEEVDLKAGYPSYKGHYEHVINTVRTNEAMFSINADAIDAAYDDLLHNGPPEDIWDSVAPNVEFEQAEQLAEGITVEREMSDEDQHENIDLAPQSTSNHSQELHARFTAELNKVRMDSQEYRTMMRSLNSKQMEVLRFHRKWCKDTIIALKHGQPAPQYTAFLSGPGGVGKSHIIKLVHHETLRLLTPLSGRYFDPNDLPVILTAYTGTAAFGINGMTLHSAFSLSCGLKKNKDYQPLSSDKLNTLRSRLGKLKLLIVDEVSMVGADLLYHLHRRLQDICGSSNPDSRFGGVSILAVGDLFQLQPVRQNHVFSLPSDNYAKLHGSLWEENFRMVELTESMRQKEDQDFANLLMRVRDATCTEEDINVLKSRVICKTDPSYPSEALHVFRTNKEVDEHNMSHLNKLSNMVFHIKAIDSKKDILTNTTTVAIPPKQSGLREILSIATGSRVMVTTNIDVSDGLVNGSLGTVIAIDNTGLEVHTILVRFDSDNAGKQTISNSQYKQTYPDAVPIKKQTVQFSINTNGQSVQAQRTQFPLSLSPSEQTELEEEAE
ncbi:uncharacterized protein LOC144886422 [Branchiostoma floridae x Branchiostoma japonicum]